MRQCICQICVCGRHRCEHSGGRVPFAKDDADESLVTEHKERYRPFGFQPRQKPIKPLAEGQWQGDAPTVKQSTSKKDYVAFPIKKRTLKRPKRHKESLGKMEGATTYNHDFVPKEMGLTSKVEVPGPRKDGTMPGTLPGQIEGLTTYNKSYTPKIVPVREKAVFKDTLTEFGKPFIGQTETGLSYTPHPIQKREEHGAKVGNLKTGEGDFQGSTTHQTDYTPKYQAPAKPIKKFPRWKAGQEKFEGETTHSHDYTCPVSPEKTIACVPKQEIQELKGPFEKKSLYKQEFKPHKVGERKLPKWHPLSRPAREDPAPFEGETTYQTDYEAPPEDLLPNSPKPQRGNLTLSSGPMEKTTTFMRDFQQKKPVPTRSFRPDAKYVKPKDKFAGQTVTGGDYTPKEMERTSKIKQLENLKIGGGAMEDMTTTMKDFQWLAIECPAAYIKVFGKDALPQFQFEKKERGHTFFKRLKTTKCHKTGLTKKVRAVA